jgi:hypothetical protein
MLYDAGDVDNNDCCVDVEEEEVEKEVEEEEIEVGVERGACNEVKVFVAHSLEQTTASTLKSFFFIPQSLCRNLRQKEHFRLSLTGLSHLQQKT